MTQSCTRKGIILQLQEWEGEQRLVNARDKCREELRQIMEGENSAKRPRT